MPDTAVQPARPLVLVVDDEPQIRRLLDLTLDAAGYRVISAASGHEGLVLAAQHRPDILVLDLGLPDLPGLQVLRRFREWAATPVLILSVQDAEPDKIAALDAGADDYVTKPFNTGELLARLRVALRHARPADISPLYRSGPLVVDLTTRHVTSGGQVISLTATEYAFLALLVRHAGRIVTHRQILREVWGPTAENQTHYLRVYVARLRQKLEPNPEAPELLRTEPGIGYRLAEAER